MENLVEIVRYLASCSFKPFGGYRIAVNQDYEYWIHMICF